ncbi:hypothetical protein ACQPW3_05755 [Actinosynnema sp. CA-248983]
MTIAWLWLRAHRWPALLATSCAVALAGLLVGGEHVSIPSFAAVRRLSMPVGQLLPFILACAVGLYSRTPTSLFRVVPRSRAPQRTATASVFVATVLLPCLVIADGQAALRNTLGLTGMALGTAVVAGATRSWTLPLFYLMGCLLFGSQTRTTAQGGIGPHEWAFPIAPSGDAAAMALAIACCVAGLLLYIIFGAREEVTSSN